MITASIMYVALVLIMSPVEANEAGIMIYTNSDIPFTSLVDCQNREVEAKAALDEALKAGGVTSYKLSGACLEVK